MAEAVVLDQLGGGDSLVAKTFFLLLFSLLIFFLLLLYFSAGAGQRTRLPPTPPGLPLIGHAHLIGALPHVSLRGLATRKGCEDFMIVRLGAVATLVASSARAAQAVLRTHDQSFASRARSVGADVITYGASDVVFASYGEQWRQSKKLVTTHLLSAKEVQSYRAARHEEVGLVIDKIHGAAAGCEAVNMSELLSKFSNDMVCRAVAGRSFRVEGRDRVFRELIAQSFAILGGINLENFYPGLAKAVGGVLLSLACRKAEKLRDRWIELLDKLIDQHLSEGTSGDLQQESDFIHVLLAVQKEYGLTRDNIWGILSDMFAAGTDTTYLVLEFAMAELMLHQDVMAKLQAEVRKSPPNKGQIVISEDNLVGMTYLKAVIKETLRLHPPAPLLVPHLCQEDCAVDGYTIPSGMPLLVNAWAIGRDPRLWDAAEEFMPERFIHAGNAGGADFRGMDFQFLPFGSGRRICPGINFALASIEIMLANLVFHFDWELPLGEDTVDMTEVFRLTASRKEKLILNPRSRGDNTQ